VILDDFRGVSFVGFQEGFPTRYAYQQPMRSSSASEQGGDGNQAEVRAESHPEVWEAVQICDAKTYIDMSMHVNTGTWGVRGRLFIS
jgi:hypothetical protein